MRLHHTHSVFTKLGRGLTWNLVLIVVAVRQMRFATVLLITIVLMVMVELSETRRRGGISRGSRSSRSRSSSGGSSSKPEVIKYTPIKATSVRSPVIVKQTKLGSRSSTFKRVGRKESMTTWLTWQLQWNTKMEKRKHYTESTKQCRWKTPRIKTLKL